MIEKPLPEEKKELDLNVESFQRSKQSGSVHQFLQNTLELNLLTLSTCGVGTLSIFLLSLMQWESPNIKIMIQEHKEYYEKDSLLFMWILTFVIVIEIEFFTESFIEFTWFLLHYVLSCSHSRMEKDFGMF